MRDIGKVALRDRGSFDASVSYEILDIVEYQGYVYCCFTPDTPAGTLPTDSTHFHRWFGSASAENVYQTNDSVENDIVDADYIPFLDSSDGTPKRSLWSNLKSKFWAYVQSQLATVATSGNYNDLSNKPTVDSALSTASTNAIQNAPVSTAINSLNTSLTQKCNSGTNLDYYTLLNLATITTSGQTLTLYGGRKLSDYVMLCFNVKVGTWYRNGNVIPLPLFSANGLEITLQSGGTTYYVDFLRVDDTHITISTNYPTISNVSVSCVGLTCGAVPVALGGNLNHGE